MGSGESTREDGEGRQSGEGSVGTSQVHSPHTLASDWGTSVDPPTTTDHSPPAPPTSTPPIATPTDLSSSNPTSSCPRTDHTPPTPSTGPKDGPTGGNVSSTSTPPTSNHPTQVSISGHLAAPPTSSLPGPSSIANPSDRLSPALDVTLTVKDLKKALYPARAKWRSIGIELDVNPSDLDNLQSLHARIPDANGRCLEEVIRKSNPNLASVLTALREVTVDEEALAHEIENKCGRLHEAVVAVGAAGEIMDNAGKILGTWQEISSGHGRHNLTLGVPTSNDVILYQEQLRKGNKIFTVSHKFSYDCRMGEEITAVLAYDVWHDDTGGNPERVSGGVGQEDVTIKITSRYMRGFHFKFIVYGRRK